MIKAYHRVSSNAALKAIMDAGEIIPAAYRLDPDRIIDLCREDLDSKLEGSSPSGQAIIELVEEAISYFKDRQRGLQVEKTRATALKCIDILSGDAGRIFLSPGTWSEAGRGLGWPLSGFVFDAEVLIENGAVLRKWDFFSNYQRVLGEILQDRSIQSVNEAKKRFLAGIQAIHGRQLVGGAAVDIIRRYEIPAGMEHLKPYEHNWHPYEELVWDGPLPLDLVIEIWENDVRIQPS